MVFGGGEFRHLVPQSGSAHDQQRTKVTTSKNIMLSVLIGRGKSRRFQIAP